MLEPTSNTPSRTVAPAPFNQPSADITLRTPDLVDFHVHSQILSQASPIFADMLSLPQPSSPSATRPLVDVSEDSKTLENLMRLCYPIAKPKVAELADLASLLEAAAKYEMVGPPALVNPDLLDFAAQDPFKVWAIACRFGPVLEPAAQCAVARMVEMSKDHYRQQQQNWQPQVSFPTLRLLDELLCKDGVDTLRGISAGGYYRLVEHIRARRPSQGLKIESHQPLLAARSNGPSEPTLNAPPSDEFIPRLSPPDVELQCADGTRHRAHIVVLGMHSRTLQERIRAALAAHEPDATSSGQSHDSDPPLPVLKLDIDSSTLAMLLALCYVGRAGNLPPDPDPRLLIATLIAAQTLGMESVMETATGLWNRAVDASPLETYFIAAERGQHDLAASAARKALEGPVVGVYARSMETCPALAYHRLLAYYTECAEAARDAVKREVEQAKNNMNIMYVDDVGTNYYNQKEPQARLRLVHHSQLGKHLLTSESSYEVLTDHSSSFCYASSVQLPPGTTLWGGDWRISSYAEASVRLFDSLPQAITNAVEKVCVNADSP